MSSSTVTKRASSISGTLPEEGEMTNRHNKKIEGDFLVVSVYAMMKTIVVRSDTRA